MKILMTYHGKLDINSGAAGSMINIGKNLENLGVEVDYFTYDNLPQDWDRRLIHFTFPFFVYKHVRQFRKWDIVDACTGDSWLLGNLKSREMPKIVIRSSGLEHLDFERQQTYGETLSLKTRIIWGGLNLKVVEFGLKSADHIIALTHPEKQYIEGKFSIPAENISVLYHALPLYFRNLPIHEYPAEFKILYVGLWHERKGIQYLIEALEMLSEHSDDFSVTLAGVKVEESVILTQISDRLARRVTIIPSIEHSCLPQIYLNHSIFVFPSLYEGFGKVLTEAMASGIPIITTQTGIAAELIKEGQNGVIIPYRDSQALYQALVWSINHREKMREYGENAKLLIDRIDFDQFYQSRIKIYQDLIS